MQNDRPPMIAPAPVKTSKCVGRNGTSVRYEKEAEYSGATIARKISSTLLSEMKGRGHKVW